MTPTPITPEAAQEISALREWKETAKLQYSLYDCLKCSAPVMRGWTCPTSDCDGGE